MFDQLTVTNRLGQPIELDVKRVDNGQRAYLFVHAPKLAISSLVAKNAEHFAHQLVERFELDHRRVDFIEVRDFAEQVHMIRWRFVWVGNSAISASQEEVSSSSQQSYLASVLGGETAKTDAIAV